MPRSTRPGSGCRCFTTTCRPRWGRSQTRSWLIPLAAVAATPKRRLTPSAPGPRRSSETSLCAYAVGNGSPFAAMYNLNAVIVLLGVGHNRNSFLHPCRVAGPPAPHETPAVPVPGRGEESLGRGLDVGNDNGTHSPGSARSSRPQAGSPAGPSGCPLAVDEQRAVRRLRRAPAWQAGGRNSQRITLLTPCRRLDDRSAIRHQRSFHRRGGLGARSWRSSAISVTGLDGPAVLAGLPDLLRPRPAHQDGAAVRAGPPPGRDPRRPLRTRLAPPG